MNLWNLAVYVLATFGALVLIVLAVLLWIINLVAKAELASKEYYGE